MNPDFDVLILGGGLVGSSLACALDGHGLRLGLVEASLPQAAPPGFDERKLALAAASMNALGSLGVIECMASPPSPIRAIHVSRAGDFGSVRLRATDSGRASFGGVVSARDLGMALERRLSQLSGLQLLRPQTVVSIARDLGSQQVTIESAGERRVVATRLLVAADGTRSFARSALGIDVHEHDYGQTLIVSSVSTSRPADGTAYERFTDAGPTALLPMGRDYGAICTVPRVEAPAVLALDDAAYADFFQERFGWRAGRIERVGRRHAYPLSSCLAQRVTAPRAVLVGNAAQTIHPVGAQGFNLGLRDALALAELLDRQDPGSASSLAAYAAARREDRERTLDFSDGLARFTANDGLPARLLRSAGLLALGNVPGFSAPLVAGAMGFRGRVATLSRGGA